MAVGTLVPYGPIAQTVTRTIEEQTSSAGQTVFTLTGISYVVGSNNLGVYVNGVLQSKTAYTETSPSVVTFHTPPATGASVVFVSWVISDSQAAVSANAAAASAANALTSENNAAASEASALAHLQSFTSSYYGSLASDPALDPNGQPPTSGDVYWNTTSGDMRIYDGAQWVVYSPTTGDMLSSVYDPAGLASQVEVTANKGAPNGYPSLDASGRVAQSSANEGASGGVATLDANSELVQMPAGTAAEIAAARVKAVHRADGTWADISSYDYLTLQANFYGTASVFANVSGWSAAISSGNFTTDGTTFTCAVAGRYRVVFLPAAYNNTLAIISVGCRLLFSVFGARAERYYTHEASATAYSALANSETIVDMSVGDTFTAQFFVTSNINSGVYLLVNTNLLIERIQ